LERGEELIAKDKQFWGWCISAGKRDQDHHSAKGDIGQVKAGGTKKEGVD